MPKDNLALKYWEYALTFIKKNNPDLFETVNPINRNALNGAQKAGIAFVCLANRRKSNIPANAIAVEMYIDGRNEDKDRIKEQFRFLYGKKTEIEERIPGLQWNENPEDRASSIILYKEIDFTQKNNWNRCAEFHATMMKKLYECAFLPYEEELTVFLRKAVPQTRRNSYKSSIMLSSIIKEYGLDPETTKLVRHSFNDEEVRVCLEKGYIEAYQAVQKYNKFNNCTHMLSFIGEHSGTTAIFHGLYEVREHIEADGHMTRMPDGYPFPEQYQNDRHWYDLKKEPSMSSLEGRLKIDWGDSAIQWCQNGTTDKRVIECPRNIPEAVRIRIVFCNIAYMKYYDSDIIESAPVSGGSFVIENGYGFERNNFHIYETENGKLCRGFVETGHSGQWSSVEDSHELNIPRIDPNGERDGKMDGVTVVFCASRPERGSVIIGWYRNATVYRKVQDGGNGNIYSFIAASDNCVLLDEDQRVFPVPRNKEGGFGRFNVWYADNDESKEFVSRVMRYIVLNKEQSVDGGESQVLTTEEFIESGKGKHATVNIYERNAKARRECLRKNGYRCFVCGFESAERYGVEFRDKIEVHHIVPISERKEDYRVDPVKDLIPVCPNCHTMLHVRMADGTHIKWEELRDRLKHRSSQIK